MQSIRTILVFFMIAGLFPLQGQKVVKAILEGKMVMAFEAPYKVIEIDDTDASLTLDIGETCAFLGKKKLRVLPENVLPGMTVDIEFQILNGERVVTAITTDIEDGSSLKVEGLLEAVEGDIAYIDGYRVKLDQGVLITGKSPEGCGCKGMLYTGFQDKSLKVGGYFLEIKGAMTEEGVLLAKKAEACKNLYKAEDAQVRQAVEQGYNVSGMSVAAKPANLPFAVSLPLHKGNIKIGEFAYPLVNNLRLQGYVNSVGERLIPEYQRALPDGDPGKLHFRFYVIDNPIPNAFAFPNGMIFVHSGLLDLMENEAELAIVLGHEIAHVTHEHSRERYESAKTLGLTAIVVEALTNKYTRELEISADIRSLVKQTYSQLRPEGLANVFGAHQNQESQSDRVGLFYALQAGYDIRESVPFWKKMALLTNEASFKGKMKNHFVQMLGAVNFSYGSPLEKLTEVGVGVVASMFLDTVYTSHPKSKVRAGALSLLMQQSYKDYDFAGLDKGSERYAKYVKQMKN